MSGTNTGKIIFIVFAISRACPEKIEVVTPENAGVVKEIGNEWNSTRYDDDSYVKAYREIINTAERRNPGSDYAEESPYNTLAHSSYIDHQAYPDFYQNTHSQKFHPHNPPVIYGTPSHPVSHYSYYHNHHHHHHPQEYSSHHVIPILSPIHFVASFLAKFGLQKILNLILKIVALKIILKFVAIIALFFVLPSFLPSKDKEANEDDDRLLNDVTTWVWNGITENENEDDEMGGENGSGNHEEKPEKEEEEEEEEEMDESTKKLLNKIIKEWKEENFGGPGKEAGVKFLTGFLDIINRILGALLGYVKMKNNNMDDLDFAMFNKFSQYAKQLMKLWPNMDRVFNLVG